MTEHAIGSLACSCSSCSDDAMWTPTPLTERSRLIALFDAALVTHCHVDVFAYRFADGAAEDTLRIWCGSHLVPLQRDAFISRGEQCFATKAKLPNGSEITIITAVQS